MKVIFNTFIKDGDYSSSTTDPQFERIVEMNYPPVKDVFYYNYEDGWEVEPLNVCYEIESKEWYVNVEPVQISKNDNMEEVVIGFSKFSEKER